MAQGTETSYPNKNKHVYTFWAYCLLCCYKKILEIQTSMQNCFYLLYRLPLKEPKMLSTLLWGRIRLYQCQRILVLYNPWHYCSSTKCTVKLHNTQHLGCLLFLDCNLQSLQWNSARPFSLIFPSCTSWHPYRTYLFARQVLEVPKLM